jgi:DNA processing protein
VLQPQEAQVSESDLLHAVAVGQLKEGKRYQATQAVVEAASFGPVKSLLAKGDLEKASAIIETCRQLNLEVWPITSARYPAPLREISAPPPVLYAHTLHADRQIPIQAIGVVGTRAASIEVCRQTSELSASLARAGLTVVSGLALGIDGAAHRGALESGLDCPTIAVLAHGLDRVYPPSHLGLAREILDAGGVIVSEYAPGVEPMKHHFLARNRIIAGLSRGVVVVQAGARSGSLVTANFAADYGRDVFVVQGAPDEERSLGGATLIEQGATAIFCANDILDEYGIRSSHAHALDTSLWTTMSLESFMTVTSLSQGEVLRLELEGRLERLPGNQVRVSPTVV